MKTIYIIISALIITGTAYTQWIEQTSGVTAQLNRILKVSETNIIAVGNNGTILKTTNGGDNWLTKPSGTTGNLHDVFFVNNDTGFTTSQDLFLRTVNGGNTWQQVSTPTGNGKIFFYNRNIGWRGQNNDKIGKTTNGGQTWSTYDIGVDALTKEPFFFNTSTGYLLAGTADSSYVLKSVNGGENWSVIYRAKEPVINMTVANLNRIYLVGGNGLFIRTINGGSSWAKDTISPGHHMNDVHFADLNTGLAVGVGGLIYVTFDGGSNWIEENTSTNNTLLSLYCDPGSITTSYVVGASGRILKTTNGGLSAISQIGSEIPSKFMLEQNYPNPFNPVTNIKFSIPKAGNVNLIIYDIAGREAARLVDQRLDAGTYKYDFDASHLASGVYFYRLLTNEFSEVKKMTLIK